MDSGSKAADSKLQLSGSNEVESIDQRNMVEKYHDNKTPENFSKGIVDQGSPRGSSPPMTNQPNSKQKLPASDQNDEIVEPPSENNGPKLASSGASPGDPTLIEASQKQKTAEDVEVEHRSPSAGDNRPQLDPMNAISDTFGRGCVSHDISSNPSHEKVELVSSPGCTDGSLLPHASSNKNIMQSAYSGSEGSDSSLGVGDGTDAQQTTSPPYSPLIMEATQPFSMALAEKIPQNGSYGAQSFYLEHDVNSVQPNQLNGHIGSSLQPGLLRPRRLEPVNPGKTFFADQFEHNNGNNTFNDNQQALLYPNLFPQSPSGIGFLNGGSTEINQQAPTWVSNKENELYGPLAASGSQLNQFKPTNNSDQQGYKFILPRSSAPLRPQYFSDLHNQVPMAPGAYNSPTFSTMFPESSVSLRTSMLPFHHQINSLDVSDLPYSKASMLSSFQDLSGITNQYGGTQCSNPMLEESLMRSGSHQLSAHQQASYPFSMMPYLPNSEHPENYFLPRLQSLQQQGLLNQTARPLAAYPGSGTSLSSFFFNPLLQQETGGTSAPHQMETSLSNYKEQGISGGRGYSRSRFELGESSSSSSFKRFRRESTMPLASSAEQLNRTLSLQNEASGSNIGTLFHPRPIRNSVYDPIYEGIGLPIDPHLRLFANN